jgi:hypothetical protein
LPWALAGIAAAVLSRVMCLPGSRSCCPVQVQSPSIRGRRHRVTGVDDVAPVTMHEVVTRKIRFTPPDAGFTS